MKTVMLKLLHRSKGPVVMLLGVGAILAACLAWSNKPDTHYKLGGAWVGELNGVQWVSIHSPLDADGKTAAAKLQWLSLPAPLLQLMASLGGDRTSEAVGSFEMINKHTAKYTLIWYGLASGKISLTAPVGDEVKAINVITGVWRYTGPDTAESKETYTVYATDGTPEHNLFPGPNAVVVFTENFDWHPQYRVQIP